MSSTSPYRHTRLALVVPFLNEEEHLGALLRSLATQTRAPDQLLLVDDGSTDRSGAIARRFVADHPFARWLSRPPRRVGRDRLAGAPELVAVQWAVEQLEPWDVLGKLDADLVLAPNTLATLVTAFDDDPTLGMAGAYISEIGRDGHPTRKPCGPGHVEGATKFYRRRCWADIAPLPAILGWDMFDEVRARMGGWRTTSVEIPGGDPLHLRPMGTQDGLLRGYRRWGASAYTCGDHPAHVALIAARDAARPPRVLGSVNYVAGWALAALRRRPRAEPELRAHVRRDQLLRIRRRLGGANPERARARIPGT